MTKTLVRVLVAVLAVNVAAQAAIDCENNGTGTEGNITVNGGQINMSGASLFVNFFRYPASTNDWIDVDSDGFFGFANPPIGGEFVDQLADEFLPGLGVDTWWALNYRSVGSVNGFSEFIDSQLCDIIPTTPPSEGGIFNRFDYAVDGHIVAGWSGYVNSSGTPLEQCSIDGSWLDVPGSWAVIGEGGTPNWNRNPAEPGYGLNFIEGSTGQVSQLQALSRGCSATTLNFDTANPTDDTLYSYVGAWVPVALIANRGTGLENVKFTEMQYHFTTGRMPNGENLVGATRDVGSGTRNAAMNSLNIDPSWGRGDNLGVKTDSSSTDSLGPVHQPTNKGGSSRMEGAVQNNRLAIGYTGLATSGRAASDALAGLYEILNTCKDVDSNGDPLCDCSSYVRPTISAVVYNCDACTGYQISGSESAVVRGNIDANRDPGDPNYNPNDPPVANQAVADYLNNIFDSAAQFAGDVNGGECGTSLECSSNGMACLVDGDCGSNGGTCTVPRSCSANSDCESGDYCGLIVNSPGQTLAVSFFLPSALECLQDFESPMHYYDSPTNEDLRDYTLAYNGLGISSDTPDFGSVNIAGLVPKRLVQSGGVLYSDGQANNYIYWNGTAYTTISGGSKLSIRNRVEGDFNEDGNRDITDAAELVKAYYGPRAWQQTAAAMGSGVSGGSPNQLGNMTADNAIPEVLGDFNGDGHFSKEDLRYFADGLAIDGASLNRKAGAIAIDTQIAALGKPYPWADTNGLLLSAPGAAYGEPVYATPASIATFLATGATYTAGDFRGDIAGATLAHQGRRATAGAQPMGWDGKVDAADIDYVCEQSAYNWSDIDEAVLMDLSADMDGDLDVDSDDVTEIVTMILDTAFGDANLDGAVDAADLAIVDATIADVSSNGCNATMTCGWADGDFDCNHVVDNDDRAFVATTPCPAVDVNCDGVANGVDMGIIKQGANWNQSPPADLRADVNGDGVANGVDMGIIKQGANWNVSFAPCTCP